MKHWVILLAAVCFVLTGQAAVAADEVEVLGVNFPTEKVVEGKTLKLNGTAYRKAMGFIKVYAVGFYTWKPPPATPPR
jgi:hypothetical protein